MGTQVSTPRGVHDWVFERSPLFQPFIALVQSEASKRGKVFFLESCQGNEFETSEMEGEDLVGWLVDKDRADELESQWSKNVHDVDESFDEDFVHVGWTKKGNDVEIIFD